MAEELYNKQQEQRDEQGGGAVEASPMSVNQNAGGGADRDASGRGSMSADGVTPNDAGTEVIPDNIAQANQASISAKALAYDPGTVYVPQVSSEEVAEHLDAMFDGQELSEDFKTKASTIYEAAVNSKITELAEELKSSYDNVLEEEVQSVISVLSEKMDEYLNYVVDEWMGKNELAVERGIKTDVAESFITGLKSLFEAHYVDIPAERYDVLDDLFAANERLQESLNEEIETNIELKTRLNENAKIQLFNHYATDLADTEVEKFASLAESVSFDNVESYDGKLQQIKESYFVNSVPKQSPAELIEETTNPKISNGSAMDNYVDTLAFQMRHEK